MSKIDVIIPIKGRPTMLRDRSLPALIAQSFQDFRVTIVDDGSSATERNEIERTIEEFTFKGLDISLLRNEGKSGAAGARNFGFRHTTSEFILWYDSDDILLEHKLETSLSLIESGQFDLAITRAQHIVDGQLTESYWGEPQAPNRGLYEYHFPFQTMCALYRRSFLNEKFLFWDETLIVCNDLEFSNKVLLASDNWVYSPRTTAHYYVPTKRSGSIGSFSTIEKLTQQKVAISRIVTLASERELRFSTKSKVQIQRKKLSLMKERIKLLLTRRVPNS